MAREKLQVWQDPGVEVPHNLKESIEMALKILTHADALKARWNQPRMKRAEVAIQIRSTTSGQANVVRESGERRKNSRSGPLQTAS